ncbi:MAG: ATP-grasp domain-containing protein, partial [Patescibacteria group bacterium]
MATSGSKRWQSSKNIVLFVSRVPEDTVESIKAYGRHIKRRLKIALIYDVRAKGDMEHVAETKADVLIPCDFTSQKHIMQALLPYMEKILAITCRSEANILKFRTLIPYLPYLRTPTEESLIWSTNKLSMRRQFMAYDPSITPKYTFARGSGKDEVARIIKRVGFPCVVKPGRLAQSILVSICFHQEELEKALRRTFRAVKRVYATRDSEPDETVLVEQFMEGDMYSIDGYVDTRGRITLCPMVYVKTGRAIGFDDFFGYLQMTPSILAKGSVAAAEGVAEKAIRALGLRSSSAHVELMRTEREWKVIEVGARVGGFRELMYRLSYGFEHGLNDVLVRIPDKVHVSRRVRGYTAAMKFFAPKEGILTKLKGIKKANELASFHSIHV